MVDGLDELYNSPWSYLRTFLRRDGWTLTGENKGVWQEVKHAVWFDFVDDKFKQIPWIDCFSRYENGKFFEMKGVCVSFYCQGDEGCSCSDVWVLKRFGDENSWEKRFSFDLGGMSFCNVTNTGVCLAANGSGQVKVVIGSNQESTSPEETRVLVSARFPGSLEEETAVYVESFVSPFLN